MRTSSAVWYNTFDVLIICGCNQEKLNEYFDLALAGHINITRDSITSLLEEFGFNEEEQRETTKILMFPEDALFTYDEKIKAKEKSGKFISEVIQEAKTMVDEEPKEEASVVDALNVSRLCQIGEERLKEAWSYFEQTTPEMMENLRNPDVLYQQAVAYLRR